MAGWLASFHQWDNSVSELFEFGKTRVILGPALSRSALENAQP
jgi:hypothetical protein